jgi:hypothetical protein
MILLNFPWAQVAPAWRGGRCCLTSNLISIVPAISGAYVFSGVLVYCCNRPAADRMFGEPMVIATSITNAIPF